MAEDGGEAPRQDVGAAGALQRFADRRQGRDQHQHRPIQGGVGVPHREGAGEHHQERRGGEGDGDRDQPEGNGHHGHGQDQGRQYQRALGSEADGALGQGQGAQFGQGIRQIGLRSPQHQDVAGADGGGGEPLGDPPPGPRQGEQLDVVFALHVGAARGAADQRRVSSHHRLDGADLLLGPVLLERILGPVRGQLPVGDDLVQEVRLAFEHQHVARLHHRIRMRLHPALPATHQTGDFHLTPGLELEL